jgi:hypothetical protein
MERSYVNQIAPAKKIGAMIYGEPRDGFTYAVSTLATSTPTYSTNTSTLISSASTLPDNIGSDADSAGTYTATTITL